MKKIFLMMLVFIVSTAGFEASAQTATQTTTTTTTKKHSYYYYRNANVYYDPGTSVYWYYDEPVSKWSMTRTLPSNIVVSNTPRYTIVYDGEEPWVENPIHLKKYKVKKNGKVKVKTVEPMW